MNHRKFTLAAALLAAVAAPSVAEARSQMRAVTVARSLSDTFAGIAPANVPMFILAQLAGAAIAAAVARLLFDRDIAR